MSSHYPEPGSPPNTGETVRAEAGATAQQAGAGAAQVAETAQQQAKQVAQQAGTEVRRVADRTRGRLNDEAEAQTRRAADGLRQWSDELASMAESAKPDSPVRDAVHQMADGGRRAADYLDRRGLQGAVGELQEFARRRPGTFLLAAVAGGFLMGRMAKAAATSDQDTSSNMPPMGAGQEPETFEAVQRVPQSQPRSGPYGSGGVG